MLTTTRSFSRRARSTRLRWPAWSAPIVGTSPIELPPARHRREASSIAPGLSITTSPSARAVPDLVLFLRRGSRSVGRVLVLGGGELAGADVLGVGRGRPRDLLRQAGVSLDELRRLAGGESEHVVEHEHLGVGGGTCADSYRRDARRAGDA